MRYSISRKSNLINKRLDNIGKIAVPFLSSIAESENIKEEQSPFESDDSKDVSVDYSKDINRYEISEFIFNNDNVDNISSSFDEKNEVVKNYEHKKRLKSRKTQKHRLTIMSKHVLNKISIKSFNSVFMAILQVINCTIKYTLISIPFCIKVLGIINGSMVTTVLGLMSIYSVFLLLKVREKVMEIDKHLHAYIILIYLIYIIVRITVSLIYGGV